MSVKVDLTREQLIAAIFQYVERNYPVKVKAGELHIRSNTLKGATIDCVFKKGGNNND